MILSAHAYLFILSSNIKYYSHVKLQQKKYSKSEIFSCFHIMLDETSVSSKIDSLNIYGDDKCFCSFNDI